jgi:hypothetical protein
MKAGVAAVAASDIASAAQAARQRKAGRGSETVVMAVLL